MRDFHEKEPCVYLLASGRNGTHYTGVTSGHHQRMDRYVQKLLEGFLKTYNVTQRVVYEAHETMLVAITRETLHKG